MDFGKSYAPLCALSRGEVRRLTKRARPLPQTARQAPLQGGINVRDIDDW